MADRRTFLDSLRAMLSDERLQHVIRWSDDGMSFVVEDVSGARAAHEREQ
jgi:hypothetical protein